MILCLVSCSPKLFKLEWKNCLKWYTRRSRNPVLTDCCQQVWYLLEAALSYPESWMPQDRFLIYPRVLGRHLVCMDWPTRYVVQLMPLRLVFYFGVFVIPRFLQMMMKWRRPGREM